MGEKGGLGHQVGEEGGLGHQVEEEGGLELQVEEGVVWGTRWERRSGMGSSLCLSCASCSASTCSTSTPWTSPCTSTCSSTYWAWRRRRPRGRDTLEKEVGRRAQAWHSLEVSSRQEKQAVIRDDDRLSKSDQESSLRTKYRRKLSFTLFW